MRWIAAAPLVAITCLAGMTALMAHAGVRIFAEEPPGNPSEAAFRRDLPALMTFEQKGADLHRRYDLRPPYTDFKARAATPLEASILSRRAEVVAFAQHAAPPLSEAERDAAVCLALDVQADSDVIDRLGAGRARPICQPGAALALLRQAP